MKSGLEKILPALLLGLTLTACAGQSFEDPALMQEAREAVAAKAVSTYAWGGKPRRVRAAITPESMAIFPSMRGDMALLGVYGNYPEGDTRFALTMPQGTRIGSCTRPAGGKAEFQSASALAVIGNLVRASFASLDEFFASLESTGGCALADPSGPDGQSPLASSPRTDPTAQESWRLQKGDVYGGIGRTESVLVRHRSFGWGSYANFIYDLSGRPLVFYRVSSQALDWKLTFRCTSEKPSYIFRDYRHDWIINVEIMEVTP